MSTQHSEEVNKKYLKPALAAEQQIDLLKERGLIINNNDFAMNKLNYIGYYHLSGYFKSFQNHENDTFHKNITLEQVINLYVLDRKIKSICFDAIERIELSLKSLLTNVMTKELGIFWYNDTNAFIDIFQHESEIKRLYKSVNKAKGKEGFIKHFYKKYSDERCVPSWMLMEVISFGACLNLFKNLKKEYRKKIAKHYGFDEKVITSWFVLLLDVRNICAHHERLWNRNLKEIIIPKGHSGFSPHGKIFNVFLTFSYFLSIISPGSVLIADLSNLLKESHVNLTAMGFGEEWEDILLAQNS